MPLRYMMSPLMYVLKVLLHLIGRAQHALKFTHLDEADATQAATDGGLSSRPVRQRPRRKLWQNPWV